MFINIKIRLIIVLMKFLGAKLGFYEKLLLLFLLIYAIVASYALDYRSLTWDEMANSALPVFLFDFSHHYAQHPGLSFEAIKNYGLDYHTHYHIFVSLVHHPPFHRILMFASFLVLGISEFSARIVSVFFGLLGIYFTYMLAKLMTGNKKISFISALILGLIPAYYEHSRLVMLDVPLTAISVIVVYFFYKYVLERKRRDALLLGITLGFCVLTKNYGFLIFPVLVLYIILSKRYNLLKDKNLYLAGIIAAVIALPWYLFASVFPRLVGIPYSLSGHYSSYFNFSSSVLVQLPYFFIIQFSYVIGFITLAAIAYAAYKRDRTDYLLISWILPFYVLFLFIVTFSGFHRYVMPTLPAFAILDAKFLHFLISRKNLKKYGTLIIVCVTIPAVLLLSHYAQSVEISYPIEDATKWILSNTPKDGGVIYTDYSQLFYFLKNDRNLSVIMGGARNLKQLAALLNSTYASKTHEYVNIKNPTFYYMPLRYPLRKKVTEDFVDYVESDICFIPGRVFGNERKIIVYGVKSRCR